MFSPSLYIYAQNRALQATTDYLRSDICLLQLLALLNCPVNYRALWDYLSADKAATSQQVFLNSLNRLVDSGIINKTQLHGYNRTSYTITTYGRLLLTQYNIALEQIVKEIICKYADDHGL